MELNGKKIAVLGDSITAGTGTTQGADSTFWAIMARRTGAHVQGLGIGGTSIAPQLDPMYPEIDLPYFATRVKDIAPDTDVILVFGGTNDYGHGDTPFGTPGDGTEETFCGAFSVLCRALIEHCPQATVVVLTPLHRADEERPINERGIRCTHTLAEYVAAERTIAAWYALPVLDLFSVSGLQPNVPLLRQRYMPDGLHPNDAGHQRIADRVIGFLSAL